MSVEGIAEPRRLLGLQYLRAVAALGVLLAHSLRPSEGPLLGLGLGVDILFVLSGFLMVAITEARTRPWSFLKARIARIVPLYWTLTLATFAILWSGLSLGSSIPFRHIFAYYQNMPWERLAASLAFIPQGRTSLAEPGPILPMGWTLNMEMFFYLLFALVLLLPRRLQLAALSVLFVGLFMAGEMFAFRSAMALNWTSPIILEFLAGAWMGYAWQRGARLFAMAALLTLAWLPCMALVLLYPSAAPEAPIRILGIPLILLMLAGVLSFERQPGGIRDWAPARMLGDASYSIYLWQFLPIMLFSWLEQRFTLPAWHYTVGVTIGGIAGGIAVFYLVERPLLAVTRRWRVSERKPPETLAV